MNYVNTFISVADDCPAITATVPSPKRVGRSAAQIQYEMLVIRPYVYRQDEILFASSAAVRNATELAGNEMARSREVFFAKPQACLRTSPLAKRYGWGLHFDADGKAAAYAVDSDEYRQLSTDPSLQQLRAMRSKRG